MKNQQIFDDIQIELDFAMTKFNTFNSMHEGYAVLLEEVDELWDEVRGRESHLKGATARHECIQIAAMAIRLILDRELT